MKTAEIRKKFLEFYQSKGHTVVPSSGLVPQNDPTLLFSNAGMNQFKDAFLGAVDLGYRRAASCQECLRISGKHNDLENVGVTARHNTFFEMLGNFSFGDYFKKEAIQFAWELVTQVFKLDTNRLWFTIFEDDDEAFNIWAAIPGMRKERILRMTAKDNFWAQGDTGPCGPCSEIFFYMGDRPEQQSEAEFRKDDGTYLEFYNLVFMQFNREADGTLHPLPRPSVDTGMGMERIASILQGVQANYDSDVLRAIIRECERVSGYTYDGSSYRERDLRSDPSYARDVAMRVIADHSRAIAFLIADGVTPGSDGRGYVLRRLIRRAARHGRNLGFEKPFLSKATDAVVREMGGHYPKLSERHDLIGKLVEAEERKFLETLDSGLSILQTEAAKVKKGGKFPGKIAFLLHDTYGFPLDLTQNALREHCLEVDADAFDQEMEAQRSRSREDRKAQSIEFISTKVNAPKTEFLGYTELSAEAKLAQVIGPGDAQSFAAGDSVALIFDATPFYAESGGQVGDTGEIAVEGVRLSVNDTQKINNEYYIHSCTVQHGILEPGMVGKLAHLAVDGARRTRIRVNHSATHLLHAALRKILGEHVKQAGSRVDETTLRFDYSHFAPVDQAQLRDIQAFVNEEIRNNYEIATRIMPLQEAKKAGATALFGEKYGAEVRVVEMGPNSLELCGGTHALRTGDIGFTIVAGENGISAGVRRIECWAGLSAQTELSREQAELSAIAALLKGDQHALSERVEKQLQKTKLMEREIEELKSKLAALSGSSLLDHAKLSGKGIKVIAEEVESVDANTLKSMVDTMRNQIGSGVIVLASTQGDKANLVAGVTSDLKDAVHIGKIVQAAAAEGGGRGGGRADFAQAGGVEPSKVKLALTKFCELIP